MKDLKLNVKQEEAFKLANGKVVRNVLWLRDELKRMPQHVFEHHVNKERNDFFKWGNDIYQDHELAESIRPANKPEEMIKAIEKRIREISDEKQQEVKEIIDAIEKIKNGPIKKSVKMTEARNKQTAPTTRDRILKKLNAKFDAVLWPKKLNLKRLNLIPVCKLDRDDMINQIKKGYENE